MLVLSRHIGQSIMLRSPSGEEIAVKVVGIDHVGTNKRIKLGIKAPNDVVIAREELLSVAN